MITDFNKLKQFLDEHIANSDNTGKIDVFGIPCGLGKSRYIRYLISDYINKNEGLVVVTDSIERLTDYTQDENDKKLTEYINSNRNKIALLTNNNFLEEIEALHYKKIVLLSTQRYFMMTKSEIIDTLINYKYGQRQKIVFDERPYTYQLLRVDIRTVDEIDIAFHQRLDNTVSVEDKEWIINQWEKFSTTFKNLLKSYEEQNTGYQLNLWHRAGNPPSITEDDERFRSIINRYRKELNSEQYDTYKNICAALQIVEDGARFVSTKKSKSSGNYDTFFQVLIDNKELLIDLPAKTYVLDGTDDIPDYDLYFINKVDCSRFQRTYPNLTIRFVDVPNTNKINLTGRGSKTTLKTISDYINSLPEKVDCVFSHQSTGRIFKKHFKFRHFGKIRGFNDFKQMTNLLQVGLYRFPDYSYQDIALFALVHSKIGLAEDISKEGQARKTIDVTNRYLAADLEQNLMRSKIRNVDCNEPVIYTVLLNVKAYSDLIEIIRKRFPKAKIEIVDTPSIFCMEKIKARNNKNDSVAQKVLDWLTIQPKGRLFKVKEMVDELNITSHQLSRSRQTNNSLDTIFNKIKTDKKGYYQID